MRLLIVGGSDAGISTALRAREVSQEADITVVVADAFPNYSICGLPFFLSGEVPDWQDLAHRTVQEIESQGISLRLDHRARVINPEAKTVTAVDKQNRTVTLPYDRLVIATGAEPRRSPIEGSHLPGVHLLHSMADSFRMENHLTRQTPQSALIVGGGYIGLEIADALIHRGIEQVSLVVRSESVLRTSLSASLSAKVEEELRRCNVELIKETAIRSIQRKNNTLVTSGTEGFQTATDLVLIAVGVRPETALAQTAGIATGVHGAIQVNREMETNIPGIYAAGDCVETWHHLLEDHSYLPLGTTAHKQGRIAGENAVGGHRRFAGSLGTQVVKVFSLAVARTGLLEEEARIAGFEPASHEILAWDHKAYYPGASELRVHIIGDRSSGQLLGAQIVGNWRAEISKRIDILATALYHNMTIDELNDLDLSYAPPFSSPWDPVQMAAQAWSRRWMREK